MAAKQLMCVVTPGYPATEQHVTEAAAQLDRLFRHAGCVHFAAFALLPPPPEGGARALVLELAVDPGLEPDEMLERLLQHGRDALWSVYRCCIPLPEHSSWLVREDRLREFLRPQIRRADGGFVGERDRTVGQILAEAELYQAARAWLRQHPPQDEDRRQLARRVADWATRRRRWAWAATPPPRDFWRTSPLALRALVILARLQVPLPVQFPLFALLAVLMLALTALAATGLLVLLPFGAVLDPWRDLFHSPRVFGDHMPWATPAVWATVLASAAAFACYWMMVRTARLVTVAAFLMLVIGIVLVIVAAVVAAWTGPRAVVGFAGAVEVLVRAGVIALLAFAFLWVLLGAIGFVALLVTPPDRGTIGVAAVAVVLTALAGWGIHGLLGLLVSHGAEGDLGLYRPLARTAWWGVPAIDVIVLLDFLVLTLLASMLAQWIKLPPFSTATTADDLDRVDPHATPLTRGHRVHPSIVRCEAELAQGRVSHMFSLTEVRCNSRLQAWWLRYFLRLIWLIGHGVFTEGKLAHAEGIRFAHWYVLDGRRLLFCSNFDGSFGGYLDEFINGASEGINLVWRWTELRRREAAAPDHPDVAHDRAFPPTRRWVFGGCKYEQWFKTYARDSMLPHLYRFEAYPYSAQDVQRATRFREALFGARTPVNDDQLLRALES